MLEPLNISLASLNITTLAPMLIAIVGALSILCIDMIKGGLHKSFYVMVSLVFLLVDLGILIDFGNLFLVNGPILGMFDMVLIDGLAIMGQIIIVAGSMLFIPLALTSKRFHEYNYPEYFALFLFMIAGFQFMVATDNLIMVFVGLETASLALYALIALHNRSKSKKARCKCAHSEILNRSFKRL